MNDMKNVINRAQGGQRKNFFPLVAKKRIVFICAALMACSAPSWSQVDPCAPVTDTIRVTFKLVDGSLDGNFTVAYSGGVYRKVAFSKGNLQYRATADGTGTDLTHEVAGGGTAQGIWRFAEHQWDVVGDATYGNVYETVGGVANTKCNNALISSTYTGWVDLIGWATSGWDNTANDPTSVNYQPYANSIRNYGNSEKNDFKYGPSLNYLASGRSWSDSAKTKNYDWGVYNAISNGGNTPGKWRTLTSYEWEYLLRSRGSNQGMPTINGQSNARCAKAGITAGGGTIYGLIVFPDNYDGPTANTADITWGTMNVGYSHTSITLTTCTEAGWTVLENAGCIFLPFTLMSQNGNRTAFYGNYWAYWTSTSNSTTSGASDACFYAYDTEYFYILNSYRSSGLAVRLVKDVTE